MALCKVLKATEGWNYGDSVEAFGDRLKELVADGVVEVVVPDEPVNVVLTDEAPVAKKTRKKKGA